MANSMEELEGALKDRGLAVVTLSERGQGLFTLRDFNQGDEILRQDPYVCVTNCIRARCDICFDSSDEVKKYCSRCRMVNYCSVTCHNLDWIMHRLEQRRNYTWVMMGYSAP